MQNAVVEINDSMSNGDDMNPSRPVGSAMNLHNVGASISQFSNYRKAGISVSPNRSTLGLPKDKLEQLQDKHAELEDIFRIKREFRQKENEYEKKIALQEQKIELLEMKLAETEQREKQQNNLYEKMFQALEHQGDGPTSDISVNRKFNKKPEELFNSTQMSFGKEIENMQKQL